MCIEKLRVILWGLILAISSFGQSTITDDNWTSMTGPNGLGAYPLALDKKGNLYAGGLDTVGGVQERLVASWDGSAWHIVCRGVFNEISAIAVDDSSIIYIGGSFDSAGGVKVGHVARWNGAKWSALANGVNGNVNALAIDHSGNLYAEGSFDSAGTVIANQIAQWNGNAWNALATGISNGLPSLAFDSSDKLVTCNSFEVYEWNDTRWDTLGQVDGNSTIHTIAADKSGNIYMSASGMNGGSSIRSHFGGTSFSSIAKWSGTSWSGIAGAPLTGGISPHVSMLALDSLGNLYAGGHFSTAGGVVGTRCIARWDRYSWGALGTGLGTSSNYGNFPDVYSLAADYSGNVYVGGTFDTAGGKPAAGLARCNTNGTAAGSFHSVATKQPVGPFLRTGNIHFSLSQASVVAFKILDISGRELVESAATALGSGNHMLKIPTGTLYTGVYFFDFHAGNISYRGKFSVMK